MVADRIRILAGTGHRPPKIGGYDPAAPLRVAIRAEVAERLRRLDPMYVLSGMALGFDQDLAVVAISLGIPTVAALAHDGQDAIWPEHSRRIYREILSRCVHVVTVTPGGYSREAMLERDRYMVRESDAVLACWDGSPGGTGHTVRYAHEVGRRVYRFRPAHVGVRFDPCYACEGEGSVVDRELAREIAERRPIFDRLPDRVRDHWAPCGACSGTGYR